MSEINTHLHVVIDKFEYAFPLPEIIKVSPIPMIQPLITDNTSLVGEIEFEHHQIKVFDGAQALGLRDESRYTLKTNMLLCQVKDATCAILVDNVIGVCNLSDISKNKLLIMSLSEIVDKFCGNTNIPKSV